jgi:hypothetical protein
VPTTAKKKEQQSDDQGVMDSVEQPGLRRPRPSGNITNSAVTSLPFRCARIFSMTAVVRHSLFNAAVRRLDDDLDLPLTALAGLDGAAFESIRMRPN